MVLYTSWSLVACIITVLLLLPWHTAIASADKQSAVRKRTAAATSFPHDTTSPDPIWQGLSKGLRIVWSTEDITVQKSDAVSETAFSLVHVLRQAFEQADAIRRDDEAKRAVEAQARGESQPVPNPCTQESRIAILSVVGSIVSLRETNTSFCKMEAHPAGEARVFALDLAKLSKAGNASEQLAPITLTDYFPAGAILSALRKDSLVQKATETAHVSPKTLPDLLAVLSSSPAVYDDTHCYAFPDDLLARFAFHHLEQGKVAVRLALPGSGPCRENLTQIGILLSIPDALVRPLAAASPGSEGFLMKDADAIAKGRQTTVTFRSMP